MNEIENKIEEVKKGCKSCKLIQIRFLGHVKIGQGSHKLVLCPTCQARLNTLIFCNDILKKKELELEENQQISDRISTLIKERDEIKEKAQEDLKKQIQIEKIEKGKYKFEDFEIYGIIDKVFSDKEDNRGKGE